MVVAVAYSFLTLVQYTGFIGGPTNYFKYGITAQSVLAGLTCIAPIVFYVPGVYWNEELWATGFYIFAQIEFYGLLLVGWFPVIMYFVDFST